MLGSSSNYLHLTSLLVAAIIKKEKSETLANWLHITQRSTSRFQSTFFLLPRKMVDVGMF